MQRTKTFALGLVVGLVLASATAMATNIFHAWTRVDVAAANIIFEPRSGLSFHASPPDPCDGLASCVPQVLTEGAAPVSGLTQVIAVDSAPRSAESPPDPCFVATVAPAGAAAAAPVTVQVLHADEITFVDANGAALQCTSPVVIVTPPS